MNENKPRRRAQAQAAQKATRKSGLSRFVLMVTMMALVAVVSIGGTMAWLQDNTEEVVNTFTVGDINITLQESVYDAENNELTDAETTTGNDNYNIIPGKNLPKDPHVTVKGGSESCWLFVEITEEHWTLQDVTYSVIEASAVEGGWTKLSSANGVHVYYKKLEATASDTDHYILTDNKIFVSSDLTKDEIDTYFESVQEDEKPKLTFQAFAIQSNSLKKDGNDVETAADAWALVSGS